jgi:hypothetical protein
MKRKMILAFARVRPRMSSDDDRDFTRVVPVVLSIDAYGAHTYGCAHCATGTIDEDHDDGGLEDGLECDACGAIWCNDCVHDATNGWVSVECADRRVCGEFCATCAVPHDEAACTWCIARTAERAEQHRVNAEKKRAEKRAETSPEATWLAMLRVVPRVGGKRAAAIVAVHPNPAALIAAYTLVRRGGGGERELSRMLDDVRYPDTGKPIGHAASLSMRNTFVPDPTAL